MSDLLNEASLVLIPSGIKASKVYSQIPEDGSGDMTFSRASDATRVNSLGLVEKVRTNIILQSQSFNTSPWVSANVSGTNPIVTNNYGIAPDGTQTAQRIQLARTNIASSYSQIYQYPITITSGQIYTVSVWMKSLSGTPTVSFIGDYARPNATLTSEWVRYSTTFTATSSTSQAEIAILGSNYASNNSLSADFLAWGYQWELSDFGPTAYIPTTSSAVSVGPYSNIPRLNYQNGGGGCPSLLLEAQRTNLITYSEQMNNGAYGKGDGIAVGSNVEVSPDGYQDADKIYTNTTVNGDHYFNRNPFTSVSSSTAYTFSIFAKKGEFNYINFESTIENNTYKGATINLNNGAVTNNTYSTTPLVENYGNGWYRISISGTTGASQTSVDTYIIVLNNSQQRFYTGDGVSGIYTWGWQLEAGSFVSSYIPTLGTSVTRVADACYKTGISSLIGQSEGVFMMEANYVMLSSNYRNVSISDGTNSNLIMFYINPSSMVIRGYIKLNNTLIFDNDIITLTNVNSTFKIAFAYKSGDTAIYVNGQSLITSSTTFSTATLNTLWFGNSTGGQAFEGIAKSVYLSLTRLTNSQLAELTA